MSCTRVALYFDAVDTVVQQDLEFIQRDLTSYTAEALVRLSHRHLHANALGENLAPPNEVIAKTKKSCLQYGPHYLHTLDRSRSVSVPGLC